MNRKTTHSSNAKSTYARLERLNRYVDFCFAQLCVTARADLIRDASRYAYDNDLRLPQSLIAEVIAFTIGEYRDAIAFVAGEAPRAA